MEEIRLQKFLSNNGICSRRNAEKLIIDGKIQVNGKTVTELGTKINPEKDIITYNGQEVKPVQKKVYILLNKPLKSLDSYTPKDAFIKVFDEALFNQLF